MTTIDFVPAAPYSLERTVGAFGRFPDECVDRLHESGYRRAFQDDSGLVLLEASQTSTADLDTPVSVQVIHQSGKPDIDSAMSTMHRLLAIHEPITPLYDLMENDHRLAWLAQRLRGLRRTVDPTPFEGLVSSILAQLISIRGAAVVRGRFVRRFGSLINLDGFDYYAFPDPNDVHGASIDQLCGLGMTQTKARAIQTVATLSAHGELDLDQMQIQSDAEVIRYLVSLPGIGPWTAEWFLVNVLGRMAVVPSGDLGIRRSTGTFLLGGDMPSPTQVRKIYEPSGELRAYVAYYVLSAERFTLSPEH